MKIEAGKKYVQRNGNVVGPLKLHEQSMTFCDGKRWWYPSGWYNRECEGGFDLVAEYIEPLVSKAPNAIWVNEYADASVVGVWGSRNEAGLYGPHCVATHKYLRADFVYDAVDKIPGNNP